MWDESTKNLIPTTFISSIYKNITTFSPFTQQDCQEFLTLFMDILDNQLKDKTGNWVIQDIFRGCCTNESTCNNCKNVTSTKDFFLQLNLPIPEADMDNELDCLLDKTELRVYLKHSYSMIDILRNPFKTKAILNIYYCLKAYFKTEENEFFCDICKNLTVHNTKSTISDCPDYLLLNFKRFSYGMWTSKVSEHVYLMKSIDLKVFGCKAENSTYILAAVIQHEGFSFRGHYQIYLNFYGEWWILNDKRVKRCPYSKVFQAQPYIALYIKKSKWDELIMKNQKLNVEILYDETDHRDELRMKNQKLNVDIPYDETGHKDNNIIKEASPINHLQDKLSLELKNKEVQ